MFHFDHPRKGVTVRLLLHCKVILPLTFVINKDYVCVYGGGYFEGEYVACYLNLQSLNSFFHLYQHKSRFMDSYFILWVIIIQYHRLLYARTVLDLARVGPSHSLLCSLDMSHCSLGTYFLSGM